MEDKQLVPCLRCGLLVAPDAHWNLTMCLPALRAKILELERGKNIMAENKLALEITVTGVHKINDWLNQFEEKIIECQKQIIYWKQRAIIAERSKSDKEGILSYGSPGDGEYLL